MSIYKLFLILLLFLVAISFIFTIPGDIFLKPFYQYLQNPQSINFLDLLFKYSPLTFLLLNTLFSVFPLNDSITFLYDQQAWVVYKLFIFFFFVLTLLSVIYFKRKHASTLKDIDVILLFLCSGALIYIPLALGNPSILAAPFLILALTFLLERKNSLTMIFFIIALSFEWTLSFTGPFLLIYLRNKSSLWNKVLEFGTFLVLPLVFILIYFSKVASIFNKPFHEITQIPGLLWIINQPLLLMKTTGVSNLLILLVAFISISTFFLSLFFILKNLRILKNKLLNFKGLNIVISLILTAFALFIDKITSIILLAPFYLIFINLFNSLKNDKLLSTNLLSVLFCTFLSVTIFLPFIGEGVLILPVIVLLLLCIVNKARKIKLLLFAFNIIIFFNLFITFGTAGILRIRGDYFDFFRIIFSLLFIIFSLLSIRSLTRRGIFTLGKSFSWLTLFLVVYFVVINLALIPAEGSPDTVSWAQYSVATVEHINPFLAQTVVDQRYPPLSTAITGAFANLWNLTIGPSTTYAISTKLSILFFYALTVFCYIKFTDRGKLNLKEKLLIILSTLTLIIQTQGLADLNIYLIPSLFFAIYLLFKKKYLFSGLMMGITVSIKWQPVILIPLFILSIFTFKDLMQKNFKPPLLFLIGLTPIPILVWFLVIINPGGLEAFNRSFEYLKYGAPMLSGQALNLNWIVTYVLHIIDPVKYFSIEYLGGLNRQIPTSQAPWIFQGTLFIIAFALITLKYWVSPNKDILKFLAACVLIYFAHHQLNRSAYEKHLFYLPVFMLFLYLLKPTSSNRIILILFDVMAIMNLIFFYGFTGQKDVNRLFFGFDLTVIFSFFYLIIFIYFVYKYLTDNTLFLKKN